MRNRNLLDPGFLTCLSLDAAMRQKKPKCRISGQPLDQWTSPTHSTHVGAYRLCPLSCFADQDRLSVASGTAVRPTRPCMFLRATVVILSLLPHSDIPNPHTCMLGNRFYNLNFTQTLQVKDPGSNLSTRAKDSKSRVNTSLRWHI